MNARLTAQLLLLPFALLLGSTISACGAKNNGLSTALQPSVAAPTLRGTPIPVCERLLNRPLVAATEAIEGGIAFELATYDVDFKARLAEIAEVNVDAFNALEESYRGVRAERHESSSGVFVRYFHEDQSVVDALHGLLYRNVQRRPAAARRVSFRVEPGYVDMQLPGGALAAARASEAADEAVQKWDQREPTQATLTETEFGIRIEVRAEDRERFDDIRDNALAAIFECHELPSARQ